MHNPPSVCAILLAGGCGTRMLSPTPKQILTVGDKPLARHSFDFFLSSPEITQIVVVCPPAYREIFSTSASNKPVIFASPGARRQDSTYNGLLSVSEKHDFICVHDAARPFIDKALLQRSLDAAQQYGAVAVGMPIKFTVKECNAEQLVQKTPDRSAIWEIQTPQIIRHEWLIEGFSYAFSHNLTVTDDVSLIELLGKEVKLVEGSHTNLKVTVPSDLAFASYLYETLNIQSTHDS